MEDSDSDARARYSELLKSLQIDGFVDEFQISGKKVTVSDYDDETLHNSEGGEVDLADRSRPLFWRASILLIVCASIAYLARCKFRRPRKNNKQNNRGKIKRKRKSKSLGRKSELLSPRSLKETRGDKIKNETTKDLLVVPLARNLAAPELVVERIDPRVASKALVQDLVGKMSVEHAQLPITGDALEADLVKTAQSFRKIIEKSGMGGSEEMVSTLSWQAAMTLKQTAAICQATSMAETRRYIFQTQQSHLDREISARQHGDLLATIREDKRCPRRLAGARAECFAALKVASLRSFALILGFKPFSLAMGLLLRCKLHSFTDLVMEMRDLVSILVAFCGVSIFRILSLLFLRCLAAHIMPAEW